MVPRSRLVELVEFAEALQKQHGFPIACFGHAGDGNIHVNIMVADYDSPAVQRRVERRAGRTFSASAGLGRRDHRANTASAWRRNAGGRRRQATSRARCIARSRSALDPAGILNPGKFLE